MISSTYTHKKRGICLFIHSFIPQSVSRQVQSPFQSEFSKECDLVLPFQFTVSSPLLETIQQLLMSSSSSFRHVYPSLYTYLSFNYVFQKAVPTQDVTNPVSLRSFYGMKAIPLLFDCMQYFFISHMICPTGLLHPSNAPHFKTFKLFLIYFLRSSVIFFSIYAHKHRNTRVHCKFPAPIGTHRQSDSVHHALCGPGCFYTISQVPDAVMTERSSTSQLTPGSSFHFTFFSFFSSLKC